LFLFVFQKHHNGLNGILWYNPEFDTFENKKCSQRAWLCAL
jgi:hypothetical protein